MKAFHPGLIITLVSVIVRQVGATKFEEIEHEQPAECNSKSNGLNYLLTILHTI